MKVRLSHVTNSSSSSFTVYRNKLTEEQIEFIESLSYWKAHYSQAEERAAYKYTAECSCNQEDICEELEAQGIPYHALIHYGHETYVFTGKHRLVGQNYGEQMGQTGGHVKGALRYIRQLEKAERETGKDYTETKDFLGHILSYISLEDPETSERTPWHDLDPIEREQIEEGLNNN